MPDQVVLEEEPLGISFGFHAIQDATHEDARIKQALQVAVKLLNVPLHLQADISGPIRSQR